jgi:hypothetical protein
VPEISRFFGIVIAMFYNDHDPVPLPRPLRRAAGDRGHRGLVTEWAAIHREGLRENWRVARQQVPLRIIAPLE